MNNNETREATFSPIEGMPVARELLKELQGLEGANRETARFAGSLSRINASRRIRQATQAFGPVAEAVFFTRTTTHEVKRNTEGPSRFLAGIYL